MKKQTWYHNLGFFDNPFSIKASAFHDELEANDNLIKDINNKIADGNMVLIYGEYGTGKSSILKKVIHEFKGKRKVIYYNCNQKNKSINFDKLLINAGTWIRKIFRVRKKNMILLLDEALDMNKKDIVKIKQYYDNGFFKSVIFVSKIEDIKFIRDLETLIGRNKYLMKGLDKDDAVKLARKRIGDLKFISDDNLVKIFMKNRNPRAFLRNCENVFKYAYENGAQNVNDEHIRDILG